jgi:hypothetical protein
VPQSEQPQGEFDQEAPVKKRRRRRKPVNRGAGIDGSEGAPPPEA